MNVSYYQNQNLFHTLWHIIPIFFYVEEKKWMVVIIRVRLCLVEELVWGNGFEEIWVDCVGMKFLFRLMDGW